MQSGFDLALGLFRPTPSHATLALGREGLEAHLHAVTAFNGKLEAPWSPHELPPHEATNFNQIWLPVESIALTWLSQIVRPAVAEGRVEGALYQIYCRSMHGPRAVRSLDFFHRHPIHPEALNLCCDLLTLRHYPIRFLPEILGVTLAHQLMVRTENPAAMTPCLRTIDALEAAIEEGVDSKRIRKGYALYRMRAQRVIEDLEHPSSAQSRREAFAEIIAKKAASARGYHEKIQLEGQPLDVWFERHEKNPEPLVKALEKSPWVEKTCPLGSRLIKAMDFGGPMFGVFDAAEREITEQWIASPEAPSAKQAPVDSSMTQRPHHTSETEPSPPKIRGKGLLFHRLVAAENSTELPIEGVRLIHSRLRRTQQLQNLRILPKAFHYQPDRLDQYLHDRHAAALKPPKRRLFSQSLTKEDWRWILIQLSPAVLVDGAWLSGVSGIPGLLQPWHLELITIHEDELGNGNPRQNHPRIYRQLLESLDIYLPKIRDPAFIQDQRIHPAAFTFPSYMVAMGWHYLRFEPECLGLNLAIELSGLGAGYQSVIASLRKAGIDPLIAELHLSIDNLASGHARRARDAIVLYLENVARNEGPDAEELAWQRIHRGYLSYGVGLLSIGSLILGRQVLSRTLNISK